MLCGKAGEAKAVVELWSLPEGAGLRDHLLLSIAAQLSS